MSKIWNIKDANINETFRLVQASFAGYLKPDRFERLNPDSMDLWYQLNNRGIELVKNLADYHFKNINPNFSVGIDYLDNPFHVLNQVKLYFDRYHKRFIENVNGYREGKIILMDSGGLQLFRAKKGIIKVDPETVLKKLHSEIFPLQAKANLAFAFDHIVDNFTYKDIKESALKTVENIKDQLKIFDEVDGQASLLPIFSPMFNFRALDIWEDILIDNLPWDNPRLQNGVSFGGLNSENISYNRNLTYYYIANIFRLENKLKKVFGSNYRLPYLHMLGLSDRKDTHILFLLVIDKHFNVISSDGRSYVMSFTMGRANRYNGRGQIIKHNSLGKSSKFREVMLDNLILFEDIIKEYFPYPDIRNDFDLFLQNVIDYYDKNKRNDKNRICYESMIVMETYTSLLNTMMFYIHKIEDEIDEYRKHIEICKNDPDKAVKLYLDFPKHHIQEKTSNIDVHELI